MRVVAGKYRAKKLKEFDISSTRPTLVRVKEAVFSAIQFDLLNASVLDLFAGTGALGIEAISRGAKLVHFVDKDNRAMKLIKENTKGITEAFEIFNLDYLNFLDNTSLGYDVILLDPPYASNFGEDAIEIILDKNLLNDGGVIVFELEKGKEFNFKKSGYTLKEKCYGRVKVIFLRKDK